MLTEKISIPLPDATDFHTTRVKEGWEDKLKKIGIENKNKSNIKLTRNFILL